MLMNFPFESLITTLQETSCSMSTTASMSLSVQVLSRPKLRRLLLNTLSIHTYKNCAIPTHRYAHGLFGRGGVYARHRCIKHSRSPKFCSKQKPLMSSGSSAITSDVWSDLFVELLAAIYTRSIRAERDRNLLANQKYHRGKHTHVFDRLF